MNNVSPTERKRGRRSIVAAGSNTRNMLSLSMLLQRFAYEVVIANTAAEALERISSVRPALVITDLNLPDMSGMELFHTIRQGKGTGSLPVIFMIHPGDAAAERRCMDYGAAGCISKPVQSEELYRSVQRAIEPRPRSCMRIDTRLPVSVNDRSLDCPDNECSIDLSEHGMFVQTHKPYPRNNRVTIQIHIKDRTISAESSVLHSRTGGAGSSLRSGMGLKFTSIAPRDQEFIRRFIHDEVTKDLDAALSRVSPAAR